MFLSAKHLPKERILLGRRIRTEARLFALVAAAAAGHDPATSTRVRDRLARRSARRPVALGGGLALPHAAVPGLFTTLAVFVRSSLPIEMETPDGVGVTQVLALLVPSPGLSADYDLLMSLTAWLSRGVNRDALHQARTAAEIQSLFLSAGWH